MSTILQLFADNQEALSLTWLAGRPEGGAADRPIPWNERFATPDLVGYLNLIHSARIQVLGHQEIDYLARFAEKRHRLLLVELGDAKPPALLIAEGLAPPAELVDVCNQVHIPLIGTPVDGARLIDLLRDYLARTLAERTTMHGVLMDVLGVGVLITGESGLGKSELALELISRGHGLVADDVVELSRVGPHSIEGRCPKLLTNLLEVRGLGLLDIKAIFGETAVRRKMRLRLIVHLVRRTTMESQYQRMPLDVLTEDVLGLAVRKVVIPVDMGRNIAVLAEAAVRNTILQLRGIDTMREFMQRQAEAMRADGSDALGAARAPALPPRDPALPGGPEGRS